MKRDDIVLIPQPDIYSCNATCVAMLAGAKDASFVKPIYNSLTKHGVPGDPTNLNAELTYQLRGLAAVSLDTNASMSDMDKALADGKAVVTHGYFTRSGHIIVIVGKTEAGYQVLDPWSEFDGATFSYNKGSYGFAGEYSRGLIYATCVGSNSYEEAFSLYDGGWDWTNMNEKGMWLHTVDYLADKPLQFSSYNTIGEKETVEREVL